MVGTFTLAVFTSCLWSDFNFLTELGACVFLLITATLQKCSSHGLRQIIQAAANFHSFFGSLIEDHWTHRLAQSILNGTQIDYLPCTTIVIVWIIFTDQRLQLLASQNSFKLDRLRLLLNTILAIWSFIGILTLESCRIGTSLII